jgi:murein DD-endopeptidase MepM/ murein hydrolase activator NlpD
MKKKFYASLCLGMSLTVTALPSFAKTPQPTSKKQVSSSAKPAKPSVSGKKTEPKKPLSTAEKQKPSQSGKNHSVADVKNNKHDKSEKHQLADTKDSKHGKQLVDIKDSKHGKNKSQLLADDKDSKHGKSKFADAKDNKHGRTKTQQLADARDKKHGRKKSHHAVDESYADDNEDASTAVIDEQEQTAENSGNVVERNSDYVPSQQPSVSAYDEKNQALITAPPKSSHLFFQPLNKNVDVQPLVDNQTKPDNRLHTSISNGTTTSNASNVEAQPLLPFTSPDAQIQPSHNGNRVHSSIASNGNNFIDNGNSEVNAQVVSTYAVVGASLTTAGENAGLSNDMIIELTDIFAWDIDFANNLQADDQFTVIYEQTASGKTSNRIIAAQFVNQGKTYTAIRYKDKEGIVSYYTPEGRSMRKAFLSAPIDVVRVSSPFSTHRRHPILNRIRAHKGVDYAARTGTPVKAAGDGVIMFHGIQGGYGNMIVIAHGEHYETAYAHLSNFRKDLEDGEIVKQGDVIGYVGQSGLATGPHLHYEFRVDGVHRDPENLDSKQAMRLANEEWQDFHAQTIPMLTQLTQAKAKTLVAKNP